jgi:uncharacterized protein (TIGR03435 family)
MSQRSALLATSLIAITLATAQPARAQELALPTPEAARLSFDVISIHPSKPGARGGGIKAMPSGQGYLAEGVPLKLMISLMYKIPMRQITGGPAWLNDQPYDIQAKADKAYNLDDLHAMFQNLLVERFGLKFHVEKKEGSIYALTIDSSGLKMTPNTKPEDFIIPWQGSRDGITGIRVPMIYLCWQLGQILQNTDERPVIDMTGLTGNYDFKLVFLPELPPGVDKDSLPPGFLDRPNLFTALREQLGLKLTPQKGPVSYMVIDHIEKPTEN